MGISQNVSDSFLKTSAEAQYIRHPPPTLSAPSRQNLSSNSAHEKQHSKRTHNLKIMTRITHWSLINILPSYRNVETYCTIEKEI